MNNIHNDEKFDIVDFIERNPITTLSGMSYGTKLVSKIKQRFTEEEQKMFATSFYCYLKYDPTADFVVDFDDVWKWCGFSRKADAKKVLERHFTSEVDYQVRNFATATDGAKKEDGRGGLNKELITLTVNTFKKFCMKAGTKKADEIHDYYIKLEGVMHEAIDEASSDLRLELLAKEARYKKLEENHNRILYKRRRHTVQKGNCFYLLRNPNEPDRRLKFGITSNMNMRTSGYNTYFDPEFIYVMFTQKNGLIETNVKTRFVDNILNNTEWIVDVDAPEIIEFVENLAKTLLIEFTPYHSLDAIPAGDDIIDNNESGDTRVVIIPTPPAPKVEIDSEIVTELSAEVVDAVRNIQLTKRCGGCKKEQPVDSFSKDASKTDGLHTTCRTCSKTAKNKYKNRDLPELTEKECALCHELKPIDQFTKHAYTADGYVRQCNKCSNDINNQTRKKAAEANVLYKCGRCMREYSRKDVLTAHQKTCTATAPAPQPKMEIGPFKCGKCNNEYVRKETLVKHQRVCDPSAFAATRVNCNRCGKDFSRLGGYLERHQKKCEATRSDGSS